MLVVSCQDVAALREALAAGKGSELLRHLIGTQRNHIVLQPSGSDVSLGEGEGSTSSGIPNLPATRVGQLWQEILESPRLVRCTANSATLSELAAMSFPAHSAPHAAVLRGATPDVAIMSADAAEKVRTWPESDLVVTFDEYPTTSAYDREQQCSISLEGRNTQDVARLILRPAVTWAKSIYVVDPHIGRGLQEGSGGFGPFLRLLVDTWFARRLAEPRTADLELTLITAPAPDRGTPRAQQRQIEQCVAASIGGSQPDRRITCKVKLRRPDEMRRLHDRFLVIPNLDVVLGFTRGFDFICDGRCKPCEVFVRQLGLDSSTDTLSRILEGHDL